MFLVRREDSPSEAIIVGQGRSNCKRRDKEARTGRNDLRVSAGSHREASGEATSCKSGCRGEGATSIAKPEAHIAKPKSEPKVSLVPKWVLKEKAHVEKPESEPKVSLVRPKNPPKRPPPPPPVPSPTTPLSETEGSVHLHDQPASEPRSAPKSGSSSGSYYSTEESGKAD